MNKTRKMLALGVILFIAMAMTPAMAATQSPAGCLNNGVAITGISKSVVAAHIGDTVAFSTVVSQTGLVSSPCDLANTTVNFTLPNPSTGAATGTVITLATNALFPVDHSGDTCYAAPDFTASCPAGIVHIVTNAGLDWKVNTAPSVTTATAEASFSGILQDGFDSVKSASGTVSLSVLHPAISVTKSASAPKVENNTSVTYTYVVKNTGDTTLSNVSLTDNKITIPGGNVGTLTPSQSVTLTASAILTTTTTNTATATGTDQTGVKVTNTSQAVTVTVIHPAISLTKTASPTNGTSPLAVTYTYVVTNTGDTTLSNVTVSDNTLTIPSGNVGTLTAGQSVTLTASATLTTTTTNTATAAGVDQTGAKVTAQATATVTIIVPPALGFMTGGGSVFYNISGTSTEVRVTKGYVLHCNASILPNNFEVNWAGNKFHLELLTSAVCINDTSFSPKPPVAPFDTYYGNGTGRLNGVPGATAAWKLTDKGEPGKNDTVAIKIWDVNGTLVLNVPENLVQFGNNQAHAGGP